MDKTLLTMSTAIIGGSSALLGMTALIFTIRLSKFQDIKQRISRNDYNHLYNWGLFSFIAGSLSVAVMLLCYILHTYGLFLASAILFFLQLAFLFIAVVFVFWPPKFWQRTHECFCWWIRTHVRRKSV